MRIYYNKVYLKKQLKYPIILLLVQKNWIFFQTPFLTSAVQTYDTDLFFHTPTTDSDTASPHL